MGRRLRIAIEIGVIVALAAAVQFLPGGGNGAAAAEAALSAAFAGAVVWALARLYRMRRFTLLTLGEGRRALLYGAIGGAVLLVAAAPRLFAIASGELFFFIVLAVILYVFYALYRSARRY